MSRFSNKEVQNLEYLIINCELCNLNEIESLTYIQKNFGKTISRRTYYKYKQRIHQGIPCSQRYTPLISRQERNNNSNMRKYYLQIQKIRMQDSHHELSDIMLSTTPTIEIPLYYKKMLYSSKIIERSKKLFSKIRDRDNAIIIREKEIPNNATIRREYVKCNRETCRTCEHGPYFYAYWRDEKQKLRKKYLGTNMFK